MDDLRGKNAILTGASRGLGVYIARALAQQGVNLVLAARSVDKLEDTRRICQALGVRAVTVPCDVGSVEGLRALVAAAERELGQIDILVNNAGIEYTERFEMLSTEQIEELLRVNLTAPIWLSKLVLSAMMRRGSGAIVSVSSLAGKGPSPYDAIYSASKHGLVGFSMSLEAELHGTGVTVGVVCPGFVAEAGMWADHAADGAKLPRTMRAVDPNKVAATVVKATMRGGEYIVAGAPFRPLLALGEMMPRTRVRLVRWLGVSRLFEEDADRHRIGGDRPEQRETAGTPASSAPTAAAPAPDEVAETADTAP